MYTRAGDRIVGKFKFEIKTVDQKGEQRCSRGLKMHDRARNGASGKFHSAFFLRHSDPILSAPPSWLISL